VALSFFFENAGSQPSVTSLFALASKATNFKSNVENELPKWALLESSIAAQINYAARIKS
jgi:hypothetical protein